MPIKQYPWEFNLSVGLIITLPILAMAVLVSLMTGVWLTLWLALCLSGGIVGLALVLRR